MADNEEIVFFASPEKFRKWLQANHKKKLMLWVGFRKMGTGKPSITWPESVDQALCFGWIDGVRKRIDEESYKIRFSPRKPKSVWSSVNVARAQELIAAGVMEPAGLEAFEAKLEYRSGIYSYEQRSPELPEPYAGILKANEAASRFFEAQPPYYRKSINWWIVSPKKEETRLKRLAVLIEASARGKRLL